MKKPPPSTHSRNGFSLIEVLVAMVIIGVLAIVSMSALLRIRRNVDRLQCIANLQQIGIAIHDYSQDHNGWLPGPAAGTQRAHYRKSTVKSPTALVDFLYRYLQMPEPTSSTWLMVPLFTCPAGKKLLNPNGDILDMNKYLSHVSTHFSLPLTQRPFGSADINPPTPAMKLQNVQLPSKVIALADRNMPELFNKPHSHENALNVLFIDGHVSSVPQENYIRKKDSTYEVVNQ